MTTQEKLWAVILALEIPRGGDSDELTLHRQFVASELRAAVGAPFDDDDDDDVGGDAGTRYSAREVAAALHAAGVEASVGMSGGGCHTVYVGPRHETRSGDIYAAMIGPFGDADERASMDDICIGPDPYFERDSDSIMYQCRLDELVEVAQGLVGLFAIPTHCGMGSCQMGDCLCECDACLAVVA